MFEPYDKSPLETIIKWMNSSPVGNKEYKFVFQGNDNYDVESDFRDTLRQAEAGNEKAMYEIANMYFYGFTDGNGESVRDFSKAYLWLKKLYTGKGRYSAVAASMIGRMYYRGVVQGERQSYKKHSSSMRRLLRVGLRNLNCSVRSCSLLEWGVRRITMLQKKNIYPQYSRGTIWRLAG